MNEQAEKYIKTIPEMSRGIISRALAGTSSPRQAIKAKCLACCNCDRSEVHHCRVFTCPLHAYRPFQEGSDVEPD